MAIALPTYLVLKNIELFAVLVHTYILNNFKLTKKISQIFPGDTIISLQIIVKDIHTDNKISSIERVDLIPSLDLEKNECYKYLFYSLNELKPNT